MLPTEEKKLDDIEVRIKDLGNELLEVNLGFYRYLNNNKYHKIPNLEIEVKSELRNRIDEIDNIIVSVLALYQPEARDLRTMVSCLKATNEIDKLFNLSRSQVKEFKRLPEDLIDGFSREFLIPMQRQVTEGISAAFQILGQQDAEQVQALTETAAMAESQNGDIYKLVEKSVLSRMKKNLEIANEFQSFLAIARKMEKITGRCLSLALLFEYASVGGTISRYPQ